MLGIILIFFLYVIGVISYEYGLKNEYCKFLINMDTGNFRIKEFRSKIDKYEKNIGIQEIDYHIDDDVEVVGFNYLSHIFVSFDFSCMCTCFKYWL